MKHVLFCDHCDEPAEVWGDSRNEVRRLAEEYEHWDCGSRGDLCYVCKDLTRKEDWDE